MPLESEGAAQICAGFGAATVFDRSRESGHTGRTGLLQAR
nr:MAG TPA: hypothetical protein [Caudoviricetes sp.]